MVANCGSTEPSFGSNGDLRHLWLGKYIIPESTSDGWMRAKVRRLVPGAADGTGRGLSARR